MAATALDAEPIDATFASFAALLPDGLIVVDDDGRVAHVNEIGASFIGLAAADCLGRDVADFIHPDDLGLALSSLGTVAGKRRGTPVELRLSARRGGPWRLFEMVGRDCRDVAGVRGTVVTVRDLTERRMWEVAGSDVATFQHIVQHAHAVVMVVDATGRVASVNGAFLRILGHDPSLVVGRELWSFATPTDAPVLQAALGAARRRGNGAVEVMMRRNGPGGGGVPMRFELVDLTSDPVVGAVVVTGHDISELHRTRMRLEHLASHDPLTGLANRQVLHERMGALLAAGEPLTVCFIDLDGFKSVNDTHGHQAGDELLALAGRRLSGAVSGGDLVARIGGDEFVVVCPGMADEGAATALAERLRRALDTPYRLDTAGGPTVELAGASIGVAVATNGVTVRGLLAAADRAMYAAKGPTDPL